VLPGGSSRCNESTGGSLPLFGCRARGDANAASDVDLAILLTEKPTSYDDSPFELAGELESLLHHRVDEVVLNGADPDLIHRVLREGELLVENDRSARIRFEVRARNDYFDMLPYRSGAFVRATSQRSRSVHGPLDSSYRGLFLSVAEAERGRSPSSKTSQRRRSAMLTAWAPLPALDAVFDDVMHAAFGTSTKIRAFEPDVDVRQTDRAIRFLLDVPGVRLDDMHIEVENGVLSIEGERKFEAENEKEQVLVGRGYGAFRRSWKLPDSVDIETLSATLTDGVLTLEVSKHAKARPRKISIAVAPAGHKQLGDGGERK